MAEGHSGRYGRAPTQALWPWLAQIGYRRADWYAYDLFDNDAIPNAHTILPQFQDLRVGQIIGEERCVVTQNRERTDACCFRSATPGRVWAVRRGIWPKSAQCTLSFRLKPSGQGGRTV